MRYLIASCIMLCTISVFAEDPVPTAVQTKAGIYLVVTEKDGTPSFVQLRIITIDGTVPVTPVDPGDDGTDDDSPTVPDTEFGLTKLAFEAASKLNAKDRTRAPAVATAFTPSTDATTHQAMVDATLKTLNAVLGDDKGGWSEWYATVVKRLVALERDGRFRDIEESRKAWREIKAGLEAVE